MPSTVSDARDLLIASVLCPDPVIFIDDRWLYDQEAELSPIQEIALVDQKPIVSIEGSDITIISSGHTSLLSRQAAEILKNENISAEVIDVRVLNPFQIEDIILSVEKTRNLLVVDSGTLTAGFSAEIIAKVVENISNNCLLNKPKRLALPDAPAPTSRVLEKEYYLDTKDIVNAAKEVLDIK
jgi:pyruvate dehydrogenase E1 component beta subunit